MKIKIIIFLLFVFLTMCQSVNHFKINGLDYYPVINKNGEYLFLYSSNCLSSIKLFIIYNKKSILEFSGTDSTNQIFIKGKKISISHNSKDSIVKNELHINNSLIKSKEKIATASYISKKSISIYEHCINNKISSIISEKGIDNLNIIEISFPLFGNIQEKDSLILYIKELITFNNNYILPDSLIITKT
jgi:hypothetical protein